MPILASGDAYSVINYDGKIHLSTANEASNCDIELTPDEALELVRALNQRAHKLQNRESGKDFVGGLIGAGVTPADLEGDEIVEVEPPKPRFAVGDRVETTNQLFTNRRGTVTWVDDDEPPRIEVRIDGVKVYNGDHVLVDGDTFYLGEHGETIWHEGSWKLVEDDPEPVEEVSGNNNQGGDANESNEVPF